jgi:hypothetical protein
MRKSFRMNRFFNRILSDHGLGEPRIPFKFDRKKDWQVTWFPQQNRTTATTFITGRLVRRHRSDQDFLNKRIGLLSGASIPRMAKKPEREDHR